MIRRLLKRIATGGGEIAMSLVVVMVFFLILLGLLSKSFPEGTGLSDLIKSSGLSREGDEESHLFMDIAEGDSGGPTRVASLFSVLHRVKDRPIQAIAWSDSRQGTSLYDRHAVQTFSDSGATIEFDRNAKLELGENSLVVIKQGQQEGKSQGKRASLVMLGGELRGVVSGTPDETLELDIVTAGGTSQIRAAGSEEGSAEFNIAVGEDDSTTLTMFDGSAEILTNGEGVRLESNQAIRMDPSGFSVHPASLPLIPVLFAPVEGERFYFRTQPPAVQFQWNGSAENDGYRFVLARDRHFKQEVQDSRTQQTSLVHGNLKEGTYFWRVSGLKKGLEGRPSPPRKVEMIKDTEPPALHVEFPQDPITHDRCVVRGFTEPGSVVYVANEMAVPTRAGEFHFSLFLERGLNVVTVEAVDEAGNIAYQSRVLNAKY